MGGTLRATYRLRVEPRQAAARAEALLYEQTVELPPAAVTRPALRDAVLARLLSLEPDADGGFRAQVAYPELVTARDPAQLLNVLFGNSSMHPDVELVEVRLSPDLAKALGGPRFGAAGLRHLLGVPGRPLSCTALKPMGLSAAELAELCACFARAGIDVIKDDHGLAEQATAPFAERLEACMAAVEREQRRNGHRALYAPNLIGTPEQVHAQLRAAAARGVRAVLVAPMLLGLPLLHELAREAPDVALLAHPSFTGAQRIAPEALLGTLFRAYGADAVIFPHAGGRFGWSLESCRRLSDELRTDRDGLLPSLPVPAGGMSVERVQELVAFYGPDCMLLVGGSLYEAGADLEQRARSFVASVAGAGAEPGP